MGGSDPDGAAPDRKRSPRAETYTFRTRSVCEISVPGDQGPWPVSRLPLTRDTPRGHREDMTTSAAKGAVVVGYDATQHSDAALDWALRYATDHGRALLIVHAAGVPVVYDTFSGTNETRKAMRVAGRQTTDRALVAARAGCRLRPSRRPAT